MASPDAQSGVVGPYCLGCEQSLAGVTLRLCPECGRAFDPADPRSMRSSVPTGLDRFARRSVRHAARALAVGSIITLLLMALLMAMGLLGWGLSAFLTITAVPVLGLAMLLSVLPVSRPGRRLRVCGIVCPMLIAVTGLTAWPLLLSLLVHRDAWGRAADRVAGAGPSKRRGWVGVMTYRQSRVYGEAIGFQLTGDDGGGMYLVRVRPGDSCSWYNPSAEVLLGDGWWLVWED